LKAGFPSRVSKLDLPCKTHGWENIPDGRTFSAISTDHPGLLTRRFGSAMVINSICNVGMILSLYMIRGAFMATETKPFCGFFHKAAYAAIQNIHYAGHRSMSCTGK
jgi:hypothetical protein